MSPGYVNAIRVSIQPKTLDKIAMQFPELDIAWLLTGEGDMLRNKPDEMTDVSISQREERVNSDVKIEELLNTIIHEKNERLKEKEKVIILLEKHISLLEEKVSSMEDIIFKKTSNHVCSESNVRENVANDSSRVSLVR